jgi:hypothetical protein
VQEGAPLSLGDWTLPISSDGPVITRLPSLDGQAILTATVGQRIAASTTPPRRTTHKRGPIDARRLGVCLMFFTGCQDSGYLFKSALIGF